ncbi:MAG: 7-carboxy-7-deazaguanine synthase QueE [Verrucomicrobiales bacterium]|nr:7-carboxy-7-deazaguanine synthase QueE [Verrucomicrobiales bacterium]
MKLARMPDGSPEIFHTLQGEGRNTGLPTVFIRSSLCNLHCVWCDTAYTWNWEDTSFPHEIGRKYLREDSIIDLKEEEIAKIAKGYRCPNYVFTGGEPLLQEKNWVLLMKLLGSGPHFEIETNGTLLPGSDFLDRINQLNVSPKLRNSEVAEEKRSRPDVLQTLAETGKADFKFVVHTSEDYEEVEMIVAKANIPAGHVFLMPRASSVAELDENALAVADHAKQRGYRYSDRLHLRLYGAGRGV